MDSSILEEHAASIFRVKMSTVRKCTRLHGVATQNTAVGSITAVETSKRLLKDVCHKISKVHEVWKAGTAEISWDVIIRE
jgi:hypothetical protein